MSKFFVRKFEPSSIGNNLSMPQSLGKVSVILPFLDPAYGSMLLSKENFSGPRFEVWSEKLKE